jgi:dihydrofolate reductase
MGKLYTFDMVSLDGYFSRPNGEIDWHNVGTKEFDDFAIKQLKATEMLLFGRVTYELMASYWPTETAIKNDTAVARLMNSLPKIVVAPKLQPAWENSKLINKNVGAEVKKLKQQATKDIAIFGSSILSVSLLQLGLIDEIRIAVNPVILGVGRSLFAGLDKTIRLELQKTKVFKSGNVLLTYTVLK